MILRWACRCVYQLAWGISEGGEGEKTYHILAHLPRFILVDPFWETPVLLRDQPVLCGAANKRGGEFLELCIERLIVEEDPIIMKL